MQGKVPSSEFGVPSCKIMDIKPETRNPKPETLQIRCFFAAPLLEVNKLSVKMYMDSLKKFFEGCKISWTKEENLHITLWFLGNVSERVLEKVMEKAETVFSSAPAFEFSSGDGGAFPQNKKPKVLWLGLKKEGHVAFTSLRRALEKALSGFPVQAEKNFSPHITLGRVRALSPNFHWPERHDERNSSLFFSNGNPFAQTVNEIHLLKSELHPAGSVYTVLKTFHLKTG